MKSSILCLIFLMSAVCVFEASAQGINQGILTKGKGSIQLVDLLIRVASFVNKTKNIFNLKRSSSNLVSTRMSAVLNLPP
jgi:hypothetical protein